MTLKIYPLYLCSLLWLLGSPAWAQQTAYVGLFQENWVLLNPAFMDHANIEHRFNTTMINSSYRQQWLGFAEAPRQMNVRFEQVITTRDRGSRQTTIPHLKWGLGFTREQIASFTGTGLQGNFAYYIEPAKEWLVGGGFNVGMVGQGIKLNPAQFENWESDQYAQLLNSQDQNWWLNSDFGISVIKYQNVNEKTNTYYAGFSIPQIIAANLKRDSVGVLSNKRPPHFNAFWGVLIDRDKVNIEPSLWVRSLPGATFYPLFPKKSFISADLSVRISIKDESDDKNYFWGSGGYSTSGYVNAAFGYNHALKLTGIKGGLMMNIPVSQRTLGYSVEAFLGLSIAQQ